MKRPSIEDYIKGGRVKKIIPIENHFFYIDYLKKKIENESKKRENIFFVKNVIKKYKDLFPFLNWIKGIIKKNIYAREPEKIEVLYTSIMPYLTGGKKIDCDDSVFFTATILNIYRYVTGKYFSIEIFFVSYYPEKKYHHTYSVIVYKGVPIMLDFVRKQGRKKIYKKISRTIDTI